LFLNPAGGFGSYMFAMSERISEQSGETWDPHNIKNPGLGWMIGFLFIVSFLGLFSVVPLRKVRTHAHPPTLSLTPPQFFVSSALDSSVTVTRLIHSIVAPPVFR
jgi:hypothetical protein